MDLTIPLSQFSKFARYMSDWHKINQGHDDRVALLAVAIGESLNGGLQMNSEQLMLLKYSAELHDIGRVGISNELMNKVGPLIDSEWAAIREHSQIGHDAVRGILPEEICMAILHHHENYDGTGYPAGLIGEEIPVFSRIISIADRWDALRNKRPYRDALDFDSALHVLQLDARFLDPRLYTVFLKLIKANNHL